MRFELNARLRGHYLLFITALAVMGCTAGNPVSIADTPAQKAYAIERSYNIILEGAVDLVTDSATPDSVKRAIGRIEARTTPVMDALSEAITDYVVASAQFTQGMTSAEKMNAVSRNLDNWIIQAERAISELAMAIEGGG